jgi:hypothetical protein
MTYDQGTVRTLYKKLLGLYPRAFREQLGESMEQTFNDLCNERKLQTERGLFRFVLWMFIETAIGIIQERVLLIKEMNPVKNILTNLRPPAIISFLIVLPFMILELVNRRNFNEGFPIPLFVILWILPIIFIVTLTPIVQNVRAGNSVMANPISLLLRVAFLLFIAWFWGSIMIDQMPCFMGVPNCD